MGDIEARVEYGALNILHIITDLGRGGAETALYKLLCRGGKGVDDAAVISLRQEGTFGPRIRRLGLAVHALEIDGLPAIGTIRRLRALLRDLRPDVIQGWMYHGNLVASLARSLSPGRPAVAWNIRHSLYGIEAEKPLTRLAIRANRWLSTGAVDAIIYNSRISRRQHEGFGFAADRGSVIPNGFDLDALRPAAQRRNFVRRNLNIPPDALVVGHVARFHPMKDHAGFLRAAVCAARALPGLNVLLAGRDVTPENPLAAMAVPPGLHDRFHFLGERDDVPDLMQAMDVFCQSSWSEAFPNVLGEAMSMGVPCVATDVGDSADIVGETGIIVPARDHDALARALVDMLSKSLDERQRLGQAARRRVESQYSLTRVVGEYQALYASLTAGGPGLDHRRSAGA